MKLFLAVFLITISQAFVAEAKEINPSKEKNYLVKAEEHSKLGAEELKKSFPPAAAYIKNGYTAYKITYNTINTDGSEIVASGAVFLPDTKNAVSVLNYNHGTYFPSREKYAPSYLGGGDELSIAKLFSAAGYLVVMPDYIGYGNTKNEAHPYGAYHAMATTVIDMLRAVKEFCTKNDIKLTGKYFYSGWSEGAAVAMATVKALEEKHKGEFTPLVSVLNAGPYYTTGFVDHMLEATASLRYMASYAWILRSYTKLYNINKPFSYYFTEPYATDLAGTPERYNVEDPQQLFTKTFRESYKAGKETLLLKATKDNDLWDWKPASKIVLCHGDRDEYVPIFNSEKAYNAMKEKGADVTLQIFKGQTHTSAALGYIQQLMTNLQAAN